MTSFLAESSALAFVAGIIGVILALPVNGLSTKSMAVPSRRQPLRLIFM